MSSKEISSTKFQSFEFCPAIIIENEDRPKKVSPTTIAFGAWSDRYLSFNSYEFHLNKGRLEKINVEGYIWKTTLKIISFVLTLFILPCIALIAKMKYKNLCSQHIKLNDDKELQILPQKIESTPLPQTQTIQKQEVKNEKTPTVYNKTFASYKIGNTTISLKEGEITKDQSEVLVNAANAKLESGSGVCGSFLDNAGKEIFNECEKIKVNLGGVPSIPVGHTVMTSAGALNQSKAILHTVGPRESDTNRKKLLTDAIENSLKLAAGIKLNDQETNDKYISDKLPKESKYRTIAFPPISTGIFGYPKKEAAPIITETIQKFVEKYPDAFDEINFVFWEEETTRETAKIFLNAFNDHIGKFLRTFSWISTT